jgi:hypothetical protein
LICRFRPEQAGPKRTGFDDQRPNSKRRNLIVKGLRDSLEGEFRRAVRAEAGRRDLTADAGHLHDRAAALSPHVREHGAGERHRGEKVQLEQRPQLVFGRLLDRTYLRPAGVVDQDVDPTEFLDRLIDGAETLLWVGDVKRNRVHTVVCGEVAQLARIPGGRDDTIAANRAPPRRRRDRSRSTFL